MFNSARYFAAFCKQTRGKQKNQQMLCKTYHPAICPGLVVEQSSAHHYVGQQAFTNHLSGVPL